MLSGQFNTKPQTFLYYSPKSIRALFLQNYCKTPRATVPEDELAILWKSLICKSLRIKASAKRIYANVKSCLRTFSADLPLTSPAQKHQMNSAPH